MANVESSNIITWGGDDPFTHTLVLGPTRCGKTSKILKPLIYEILKAKKRGEKVGLTVIEPKGDVARMVYEMAREMGLSDELVYVDPLYPNETNRINVMRGDKNDVAEATVAVLKSLFGKQDPFFASVQELSSRKVTFLLKTLYGDNMDIMNVLSNLRDESLLKQNVEKYRNQHGTDDLVQFFDNELLGSGNTADKYRQFIIGLRSQLENITSNEHLRAIFTGKSDIDLDEHLEKGGILAVNTALGKLGKSGDAFGMFIAMHVQLATFRRPGTEWTRVPHYLLIDEYSRYINPDVERFLSIAAEYRVALIAACQSLSQLEVESGTLSGKAVKNAILTSTRNKIVFGGLEYVDAEEVSKIMGSDMVVERTRSYDGGPLKNILPKMYKDTEEERVRFTPTVLMDGLPKFHCVVKLLIDGTPHVPMVAVGEWVPKDWKEQMLAEENKSISSRRKPPFWKLKERAFYQVEVYEDRVRSEKRKKLIESNPFESYTDDVESSPVIINTQVEAEEQQTTPFVLQSTVLMDNQTESKQLNAEPANEVKEVDDFIFSFNLQERVPSRRKDVAETPVEQQVHYQMQQQAQVGQQHHSGIDTDNEQKKLDNITSSEMIYEQPVHSSSSMGQSHLQNIENPHDQPNDSLNDFDSERKDEVIQHVEKEIKPHASFWGV